MTLKIDPERNGGKFETTGIYCRALNNLGFWVAADIMQLDKESLLEFLRSHGGKNEWAEDVVALMLGHGHFK